VDHRLNGDFHVFPFEAFFGVVDVDFQNEDGEKGVVRALGSWENKVTVTTPEDIGRLTALVVLSTPLIANKIVFIAGETISYGELADVVDQAIGRNARREVWDVDQLKKDLKADPKDTVKKVSSSYHPVPFLPFLFFFFFFFGERERDKV
jgi:hypothetical protein